MNLISKPKQAHDPIREHRRHHAREGAAAVLKRGAVGAVGREERGVENHPSGARR